MKKSPDAFRTISEVAEALDTPAHVLRFWESRFTQIKPVKRAGGRRYYRPADLALLGGIKHLLHDEGMTIRGVQKVLREQGIRHVSALGEGTAAEDGLAEETAQETGGEIIEAPFAEAETEAEAPRDNVVPLAGARAQAAPAPEVEPEPEATPGPEPVTAPSASALPDPQAEEPAAQESGAEARLLSDPDAPAAPGLPGMAVQGTPVQTAEAEGTEEAPAPEVTDEAAAEPAAITEAPAAPEEAVPEEAAPEAPSYDLAALPDESTGVAEDEDLPPTLAARLRALPAQAVPGPDGEELARLADALKALRHKVAGHARRAGR